MQSHNLIHQQCISTENIKDIKKMLQEPNKFKRCLTLGELCVASSGNDCKS